MEFIFHMHKLVVKRDPSVKHCSSGGLKRSFVPPWKQCTLVSPSVSDS